MLFLQAYDYFTKKKNPFELEDIINEHRKNINENPNMSDREEYFLTRNLQYYFIPEQYERPVGGAVFAAYTTSYKKFDLGPEWELASPGIEIFGLPVRPGKESESSDDDSLVKKSPEPGTIDFLYIPEELEITSPSVPKVVKEKIYPVALNVVHVIIKTTIAATKIVTELALNVPSRFLANGFHHCKEKFTQAESTQDKILYGAGTAACWLGNFAFSAAHYIGRHITSPIKAIRRDITFFDSMKEGIKEIIHGHSSEPITNDKVNDASPILTNNSQSNYNSTTTHASIEDTRQIQEWRQYQAPLANNSARFNHHKPKPEVSAEETPYINPYTSSYSIGYERIS